MCDYTRLLSPICLVSNFAAGRIGCVMFPGAGLSWILPITADHLDTQRRATKSHKQTLNGAELLINAVMWMDVERRAHALGFSSAPCVFFFLIYSVLNFLYTMFLNLVYSKPLLPNI